MTSHINCVVNPHDDIVGTCVDHRVTVDLVTGRELCICGRGVRTVSMGGDVMCAPCATERLEASLRRTA